jgi:hypothetical protein
MVQVTTALGEDSRVRAYPRVLILPSSYFLFSSLLSACRLFSFFLCIRRLGRLRRASNEAPSLFSEHTEPRLIWTTLGCPGTKGGLEHSAKLVSHRCWITVSGL